MRDGVGKDEAKTLLHRHRIEKLLVVDDAGNLIGLVTVKDIEKAQLNPMAIKDAQGRLRVAAASTVGDKGFERSMALIEAGVDLLVIDTAHGHSVHVAAAVERVKRESNSTRIVAGNVATAEATKALIDAGADSIKVGIGPGSICTTRIVAGVGVPQLAAVMASAEEADKQGVPVIADGGIKFSGDLAKALAGGASCAMIGSLLAGTDESPGEVYLYQGRSLQIVPRHGLGWRDGARLGRPLLPAGSVGLAEARARRDRGTGAVQGPGGHGAAPARGRPPRGDGLHRRAQPRRVPRERDLHPHLRRGAEREPRARRLDHARAAELSGEASSATHHGRQTR